MVNLWYQVSKALLCCLVRLICSSQASLWLRVFQANCFPHYTLPLAADHVSLIPRPRLAFCRLQDEKAGRAWYLFSREHDVISKFVKLTGCVSCIFNRLHAHCSVCKLDTCGKLPGTLAVLGPVCPRTQINPFYHPFYPDITRMRKDTRPSPTFNGKLGWA